MTRAAKMMRALFPYTRPTLFEPPLLFNSLIEVRAMLPLILCWLRPKAVNSARSHAMLMSRGIPPEYLYIWRKADRSNLRPALRAAILIRYCMYSTVSLKFSGVR